jgi:hypothetical protein
VGALDLGFEGGVGSGRGAKHQTLAIALPSPLPSPLPQHLGEAMSKISTIATSVVALFVLDIIYHFLSLAISSMQPTQGKH